MKLNFWQWLGVILLIGGVVAFAWRKMGPADTVTTTPSGTVNTAPSRATVPTTATTAPATSPTSAPAQ